MMKAIAASKKKNDQLDARKISGLVRRNLLPACYVAPARNSVTGYSTSNEKDACRAAAGSAWLA